MAEQDEVVAQGFGHYKGSIQLSSLEYEQRIKKRRAQAQTVKELTHRMHDTSKRMVALSLVLLMTLFYPVRTIMVRAEGVEPPAEAASQAAPTETTPQTATAQPLATTAPTPPAPPVPKTGPKKPTGADAPKYSYNKTSGMWESDKYAWDPKTGQTKPLTEPTYSYNTDTGMWDTTEWRYDAASGTYKPNVVSTAVAPEGLAASKQGDSSFDLFYSASISNRIDSRATSGNAFVTGNTSAGSARSGNALAMANIMNLLQTSASFGGDVALFSSDIEGDVFGDLYVDPAALAALQPASDMVATGDLKVRVAGDGLIENDIDLLAESGGATVSKNTTAGDATTGSARAVANVVNMINSAIATGGSFMGILNIYGNLNGDILLPPGVLNQLLASNAPTTTLNTETVVNSDVLAEFSDDSLLENNVETVAASGSATVNRNTQAGSARTGTANTNVTVLNLTGRQVIAANSLLVFVNVMGSWVGVIMDAPAGSTSAALASGVTQNSVVQDGTYGSDSENQIRNNIRAHARSGDATVSENTAAGNATSGDASAGVSIANILNSSISLADWFGVLFINVFGSWQGSFGINTAAGNLPTPAPHNQGNMPGIARKDIKVFRFVPTSPGSSSTRLVAATTSGYLVSGSGQQTSTGATLGTASTQMSPSQSDNNRLSQDTMMVDAADYLLPFVGFLIGGTMLGGERLANRRQNRKLLK